MKNIEKQVDEIVSISSKNQTAMLKDAIDKFAKNTDSTPIVLDENNNLVYIPRLFKDFKVEGQKIKIPVLVESTAGNNNQSTEKIHFKNRNLLILLMYEISRT